MRLTRPVLVAAVVGSALAAGCAAVEPRKDFPGIERAVADRGGHRIHWHGDGEADRRVAAEVDAMLARPLDADAAVQVALLNNRNLQATYEQLGIAQAELVEAGLMKNPVFDGSLRFKEGGAGSPTIDLAVAFDFLDVFFIPLRKSVAAARLESARAEVTGAVLELAARTKAAFFAVQAAEQAVEMRRQVERATAASYDLARRLREAGNNRPLDVANERALHEEARLALAAAELEAVERREEVNRLMGLWGPRTHWSVAGRLPEPSGDEAPADGLERRAVERSLELQAARAQLGVTYRELGIARPLGVLSDMELGASAERDDGEWEVGPSVALPLPIFSQGQPAVARARAEIRRAQNTYYATAVEVRSAARSAHARTVALRQQVDYYRRVLLPLRQAIVEETQLQYNAMQVGAFQLLQAKRDQIEAGRAYLAALRDYWTARVELELVLNGRLTRLSPAAGGGGADMPAPGRTGADH